MTRALIPGSFDPPTRGHLEVIDRCSALFSEVLVAVADNSAKNYWFSRAERMRLLGECVSHLSNVKVVQIDGLVASWCADEGVDVIVKGVRSAADFDYELTQATMNRELTGVQTVWLPSAPVFAHVSSTMVKEVARYGGDISSLVTDPVAHAVWQLVSPAEGKE
ncbi:MAG: pantetheine-phosphate adenylyltransferase [Actinomycetaceae bacterium]|nr:pantetheine-phosphate adenylyltransferase [Actinomycetaceae bacterium]